jgi:hypothetical protein
MKISIAKYTKNLYASEVYRELERQAVRKGHFDLTPEEQVKLAAQEINTHEKINEPVSATPSRDLVQDVARLAFAMRRKGFITQAEDLEDKLILFKQAESALYNVTQEKNKDFIDFAHPEGDFQVDGFGELGIVETIESAAAKIRAITEKNPTGKLANLSDIADLIKNAQVGSLIETKSDIPEATETTEESNVDSVTQSSINQIKEQLNQVANGFNQMQNVNFADAMTTFLHGQPGKSSVFNTLGGDYKQLDRYGAMYKAAYGQGQPTAKTIEDTLVNNPGGADQYLRNIGVQDKIARLINNTISKKAQYGYQTELAVKVKQQAQQIAYSVNTKIKQQQQLAQEEVDKVNSKLKNYVARSVNMAKAVDKMSSWSTTTLRDAKNFYIRVKNSINQFQGELASVNWILNGFGYSESSLKISQGIELIKGSIDRLGKNLQHISGANIPDTYGRLISIKRNLDKIIENNPRDSKAEQTLGLVKKMIDAIKANQTKGEKAVLDAIQGGYKNWKEFDIDTIQLLKMIREDMKGGE